MQHGRHIFGDLGARGVELTGKLVDDRIDRTGAIYQLEYFYRLFVRQKEALRRQHDPSLPPLIETEFHMRRETQNSAAVEFAHFRWSTGTKAPGGTKPGSTYAK